MQQSGFFLATTMLQDFVPLMYVGSVPGGVIFPISLRQEQTRWVSGYSLPVYGGGGGGEGSVRPLPPYCLAVSGTPSIVRRHPSPSVPTDISWEPSWLFSRFGVYWTAPCSDISHTHGGAAATGESDLSTVCRGKPGTGRHAGIGACCETACVGGRGKTGRGMLRRCTAVRP